MTWERRIGPAAYTSPAGIRLEFQYENVSRTVNKKTTSFEFPDVDGSYIQDLGRDGRKYPIRAFFYGANYDQEADAFEDALLERGVGRLEHPLYGAFSVVPFGAISRRDDLVTAANQAVIEVTFFESLAAVYPLPAEDLESSLLERLDEYLSAAAGQFAEFIGLDVIGDQFSFLDTYNNLLDTVESQLSAIGDIQSGAFNDIIQSINRGIDVLIRDPLTLAFQTIQLIQAPARAAESISDRLEAYGNLANSLIPYQAPDIPTQADRNDFQTTDLMATAAVSGAVTAIVNTEFTTQPAALLAADVLLDQFDSVVAWRERTYNDFEGVIDDGTSYQMLQNAVAVAANYLIEISFTLLQERRIVLDRERTVVDLAAELYGAVDDRTLNFLINTNQLPGSEILELSRGRSIVYYV